MKKFLNFKSGKRNLILPYLLTRPDNSENEKLPLILFLHGSGERGNDEKLLRSHGIPKYFGQNDQYKGLRVITLSPQCPPNESWVDIVPEVMELLQYISETENVDVRRISLTGLSMGGFGTWELLRINPAFFSCAAPICAGFVNMKINTLTPIRAFHGDADNVIPCSYSYLMADMINAKGGHCDLTVYHGCGHGSWVKAYEETNLIEWLAMTERKTE